MTTKNQIKFKIIYDVETGAVGITKIPDYGILVPCCIALLQFTTDFLINHHGLNQDTSLSIFTKAMIKELNRFKF